ncbi:hypothetical protein IEQ34_003573 [Dendrobium chrysotoxum]|uniref:Uncharacterized protein n=1 Tax=Dendrobium chrysotoxum TaxID=161865 RepID=A0AAV7H334_DENCH|nr:hypothetical protein IEQ34_003573 [Dendrobium chrysotoxum]
MHKTITIVRDDPAIVQDDNSSDEGFIVNGHLLKFTPDEVALLTDFYLVLQDVTKKEAKNINADINAIQNLKKSRTTDVAPPPPSADVAPPPTTVDVASPLSTTDVAPPSPTANVVPLIQSKLSATTPKQIIQYQSNKLKRKRDDKKHSKKIKKPTQTHDVYKDYKQPFYMYIEYINPNSVKESNLIIKFLYEDREGAFTSDITKWNLQTVRRIST